MYDKAMDEPKPAPHELTRWIEGAFLEELEAHRAGLADLVRTRLVERRPAVAHLVQNDLDAMNVAYTLLAVAGFDVLEPIEGEAGALRVVEAALHGPARSKVREGARAMLDGAADPFSALVAASKEREAGYFGDSFDFRRPIDDDHGYVLEIHRCLYHQVLVACGRVELMPTLCRTDTAWIDAIEPARHRLRFVRPSTFATASTCRMWFMRTDGDDPNAGVEVDI